MAFKEEVSCVPLWSQLQLPAQNLVVASFYILFPLSQTTSYSSTEPRRLTITESVPNYTLLTFYPLRTHYCTRHHKGSIFKVYSNLYRQ